MKQYKIKHKTDCKCFRCTKITWNKGKKYSDIEKLKLNLSGLERGRGWWKGKKLPYDVKSSYKKGHIPWSKNKKGVTLNSGKTHFKKGDVIGVKALEEWRKKNPVWNKGKKFLDISGERNYNWKGGVTSIYMKIRKSFEYEDWRKKVFERDNYTCVVCCEVGGRLEADHIKPFSLYSELRLDVNNGQTLCKKCHRIKTINDIKIIKSIKKYDKETQSNIHYC